MRGLPPIPATCLELVFRYDVNGSGATTWHWIYTPNAPALGFAALSDIWSQVVLGALETLLPLMSSHGSFSTCRLARLGTSPLVRDEGIAFNVGALTPGSTVNAATPIYWRTFAGGQRGHALTRLPAFPSEFTDDDRTIRAISQAQIAHQAGLFMDKILAIDDGLGAKCALVTVHRSRNGVPLVAADIDPIYNSSSGTRVATLRRRMNAARP